MAQAQRVVDAGFTRVGAIAQKVALDVPEAEARALSGDIAAQLSNLPTAITDDETYRRAKESLPVLKRAEDRVVAFFKDIKKAAHDAHKAITSKESEQLRPIADARQRLSGLIYSHERARDEARRQAEREAAEAERKRLEQAAIEEAAALEDHAPEMAAQIIEQAIAAPAPVVVLADTKEQVAGVGSRENWQFCYDGASPGMKWKEMTDEQRQRVLQFIPREYLMPDETAIGRVVKAMKSGTRIPGIQTYDAGTVVVRG